MIMLRFVANAGDSVLHMSSMGICILDVGRVAFCRSAYIRVHQKCRYFSVKCLHLFLGCGRIMGLCNMSAR
ncbi:hypothetical protein H6P81_014180 [Aristolochia fimbriata]|uniref:Secreted protein n=1 Tax=Aristolochia fimbriata TaxID=158543 RepID=A0AAV7EK34_ARIFI|nr:hypothetical protein H6P81_014180 [Aristolochia fimbriata]